MSHAASTADSDGVSGTVGFAINVSKRLFDSADVEEDIRNRLLCTGYLLYTAMLGNIGAATETLRTLNYLPNPPPVYGQNSESPYQMLIELYARWNPSTGANEYNGWKGDRAFGYFPFDQNLWTLDCLGFSGRSQYDSKGTVGDTFWDKLELTRFWGLGHLVNVRWLHEVSFGHPNGFACCSSAANSTEGFWRRLSLHIRCG